MLRLKLTSKAKKELKNISYRHRIALANIFEEIKEDPEIVKPLTRELTERYSYKVGVFRIIYKVNKKDKLITITTAGHRGTVYN